MKYGTAPVGLKIQGSLNKCMPIPDRIGKKILFHSCNSSMYGNGNNLPVKNASIKTSISANVETMPPSAPRSEEHTSELQSRPHLVCRLLLEKKKKKFN